ncbi:MAG: hypothetical protein PWP15_356 [Methanothermococcus sp.]|jgi:methylthioribose-1-phosphate isomerase|uniref:protease complex subunit PrcB family protein n=1 Tax=Methanothermococcus TaxID=155862 RepID=UPI00037A1FF9|nr:MULTISPECIES: protease complex subunit PrcB family protein [Methanothermococcus]MDK2789849.1 hypothetical protein [Methanothermococcus sp.]MDK2987977.1 hypothetical protein [Methanothermococcus sp.]
MKYTTLIFLLVIFLFCSCVSKNHTAVDNTVNFGNESINKIQNNPKIAEKESIQKKNNSANKTEIIPFKILEYGVYGKNEKTFNSYVSNNKTIIEVHSGKKPTIGYGIEITKIVRLEKNNTIVVYVNETSPNQQGSMVIQSPYEVVEVNGSYENVVFLENR